MRPAAASLQAMEMSFIDNTLDRQSERRGESSYLKGLLERPETRSELSTDKTLIFENRTEKDIGHDLNSALALGARADEMVFLGLRPQNGQALFATTLPVSDDDLAAHENLLVQDLRNLALQSAFSAEDLSVLAQARALIHWHRTHPHCSRCGAKTHMAEGGYRRDCPSCGAPHFPRPDPCVIMLITHEDRALLGRPARLPEGVYTTLAGFMEPGETIEAAVRREVFEESRVRVGEVCLVSNQPWPFPANLMLGCIGTATSVDIEIADDELEACKWCDRDEVRQMIDGTHPEEHRIPPSISIAYELIVGWLEDRI